MDPPEPPNSGLKPLKFTRVTLGQWRLFLKVESDFQFNFEPYFGVSLLYHSVTHQYLWRIWGRTRESGFVQSYPEIIAKCGHLFDRGVPCVGMKPLDDGFPLSCVFAEDCLGLVPSSEDSNVCQKCRTRKKLEQGEEMEVTEGSVSSNSHIKAEETDPIDEFPDSPIDINEILDTSMALKPRKHPLELKKLSKIGAELRMEESDRVKCQFCPKKVAQRFMGIHQMYHHQFGEFKCNHCPDKFDSASALTKHSSMAHPENEELTCPNCRKRISITKNSNELVHHIQSCHKTKFMVDAKGDLIPLVNFCLLCWRTFKTQDELQNHEKTSCFLQCDQCDFEARLKLHLTFHVDICHSDSEIVLEYEDSLLDDHIVETEKIVPDCILRKLRMPDSEPRTNIVCDQCGKVCGNQTAFRYHTKEHHGPERMCDKCEKTFPTDDKLEAHMNLVHLKTDKFKCSDCGKRCGNRKKYISHISIHQPARFTCTTCGKQFKKKFVLDQHNRIHTGEKPHKCNLCDYSCAAVANLASHIKFIHKGVPRNPRERGKSTKEK